MKRFVRGKTMHLRMDDKGRLFVTNKPRIKKGGPALTVTAIDYKRGVIALSAGITSMQRGARK